MARLFADETRPFGAQFFVFSSRKRPATGCPQLHGLWPSAALRSLSYIGLRLRRGTLRISPFLLLRSRLLRIVASNARDDRIGAFCKRRRLVEVVGASQFDLQTDILHKGANEAV